MDHSDPLESCLQNRMTYAIVVCAVKIPHVRQRNCLKHVELHSKMKLRN
jgi:hypothetical protein